MDKTCSLGERGPWTVAGPLRERHQPQARWHAIPFLVAVEASVVGLAGNVRLLRDAVQKRRQRGCRRTRLVTF